MFAVVVFVAGLELGDLGKGFDELGVDRGEFDGELGVGVCQVGNGSAIGGSCSGKVGKGIGSLDGDGFFLESIG